MRDASKLKPLPSQSAARDLSRAEQSILDLIRRRPGLSRAAIAARLGLSPAFLTKAVTGFVEEGWIDEARAPATGARGQPALLLSLRPGAVVGIGLSITTGGIRASTTDLSGDVLQVLRDDGPTMSNENTLKRAIRLIESLLPVPGAVAGIGLWVPGMQNSSGDLLDVTPSQSAIDYTWLRAELQEYFGQPVFLEVNSAAIHEVLTRPDLGEVVYFLFLDYGVGGSMVDRMRLFRGGFGQASNVGGLMPATGPRPSLVDLSRYLGVRLAELDSQRLAEMVDRKDPRIKDWAVSRGQAMSMPLSAVVQLFNPTDIIVGGLLPKALVQMLIDNVDLTQYDIQGRAHVVKPELQAANVIGLDSLAVTAASVPLFHRFVPKPV